MGTRVNYSGLFIAAIGFFLTRFTVTLAIYESPVRFYLAGVVPLVLGLGLAAFGVALAVADVEATLVRTTARWCVIGAGTMLVLVLLTLLGSTAGELPDVTTARSRAYLSNFLIGVSIGGTLTGLYAARNRRQRAELRHQANRLEVLNRLLRHEILNALTAIRGFATLDDVRREQAQTVIEEKSDAIEQTIEGVRYLTRSARLNTTSLDAIDIRTSLTASVEAVRAEHPDADISVEMPSEPPSVQANERLDQVFVQLLENAVMYSSGDEPAVDVSVTVTAHSVRVSVSDEGPGLPGSQQALLETGEIETYDNPDMGYGLNIVRLLIESYQGRIETETGADGTTITVVLPRATDETTGIHPDPSGLAGVRPAVPHLVVTFGAAVIAGVVYGLVAEQLGGSIGIIGVLYGAENAVVGWVTHEFHSIVFGFVFAGLISLLPARYRDHIPAYVGVGIAWALVLWFVAAGLISAIWLRLIGIPAPIPSLSQMALASHLAWGISLGVLAAVGYEYVTPWVAHLGERLRQNAARAV